MSGRQNVLITGCSDGGIGSALAHAFRDRGFHVFATARDVDKMASLAAKPGVTLLKLDVTSDEEVAAAVKVIEQEGLGKLDYLVNNAARNHFMPLLDESVEQVQQLFNINVFVVLRVLKAFTPFVINTKGCVVSITSISGHITIPWMGSYAATKRSMEIMTETLRLELGSFGVRVISLVTGSTKTNGLTYFEDFELPADSLYKGIEATVKLRANGLGRPAKFKTAEEYAATVMHDIISKKSGAIWGPGSDSAFVKFAVNWLPTWITVRNAPWPACGEGEKS